MKGANIKSLTNYTDKAKTVLMRQEENLKN
ncbi:hypothetical protein SAMN04489761_0846 [Tenacibaculum sp. MAR_2009_124]|nr:hypothetical protein SAMN04489761_0846 [Tenacibaculum sp. MAR_2009_124]